LRFKQETCLGCRAIGRIGLSNSDYLSVSTEVLLANATRKLHRKMKSKAGSNLKQLKKQDNVETRLTDSGEWSHVEPQKKPRRDRA
jgi:hypothetical protein